MGVNYTTAEFLLQARTQGVSFAKTLTIGRQNLCVDPVLLERLMRRYGYKPGAARIAYVPDDVSYVEGFLSAMGAQQVMSMDFSDFEGADILQDMNKPIGPDLHTRFDCVIDGGSLEHIFSFPTAIKNCMEMVKVGGHLILLTPANNYFGHGFYQFSPELFYRVLSEENGYHVERMIAVESENMSYLSNGRHRYYERSGMWHQVIDPDHIGNRVNLSNCRGVILYIQARRNADIPIFSRPPQQSDYISAWNSQRRETASKLVLGEDSDLGEPVSRVVRIKSVILRLPLGGLAWRICQRLWRLQFDLLAFQLWKTRRAASFRNRRAFVPIRNRSRR